MRFNRSRSAHQSHIDAHSVVSDVLIKQHDSLDAFLDFLAPGFPSRSWSGGIDSCGGIGSEETMSRARFGDASFVEKAEEMIRQIDAAVETPSREWRPSPSGAYPVIPEYLAGHPDPMRACWPVQTDVSPVTVYAAISASASISPEEMTARGTAILALVMKLQEFRPVDLRLVIPWSGASYQSGMVDVIPLESRPISLSIAGFCLCHPAFFRWLGIMSLYRQMPSHSSSIMFDDMGAKALGLNDVTDVYVKPHLTWEVVNEPVKWVNDQVKKFRGDYEEEGS